MSTEDTETTDLSTRGILVAWANRQSRWVRFVVGEVLAAEGPVGETTIGQAFSIFLADEQIALDVGDVQVPPLSDAGGQASDAIPVRLLRLSDVQGGECSGFWTGNQVQ